MQFCEFILRRNRQDAYFVNKILFTDKSTFTRRGIFNRKNCHIWADQNPNANWTTASRLTAALEEDDLPQVSNSKDTYIYTEPPAMNLITIRSSPRRIGIFPIKKFTVMAGKFKYSEEDMKGALEEVKRGTSVSRASKLFGVPRVTLLYKHTGKSPIARKMGPESILTVQEESHLEQWIIHLGSRGFPVTKNQLLDSVQLLIRKLNRSTPFVDQRPGRHWYDAFLRRHPNISERMSQNLTPSRAAICETNIRNWFSEIETFIETEKDFIP
ncbi:hypothetical protein NQ318_003722 [Aromia moschata]|uniref:HTH CENPB-type domain-containing protein n=1 Tax=Aromia moschata TaxID=1265417 RepID=A0AAV8XFR4_9CUCU|nr:hypothetical protein NQ318_003722 [Aromia moschata]